MSELLQSGNSAKRYRITVGVIAFLLLMIIPVAIILYAPSVQAFSILLYIISGVMILLNFTFTILSAIVKGKTSTYYIDFNGVEIVDGFIFIHKSFLPIGKVKEIKILKRGLFIYKDLYDFVLVTDSKNLVIKLIDKAETERLKTFFPQVDEDERI